MTTYDPKTGNVVEERWLRNDVTSRLESEGPAVINYDPETSKPVRHMYFADGNLHRIGGPAVIEFDARTGEVRSEEYFRFDKPYRPPLEPKF